MMRRFCRRLDASDNVARNERWRRLEVQGCAQAHSVAIHLAFAVANTSTLSWICATLQT